MNIVEFKSEKKKSFQEVVREWLDSGELDDLESVVITGIRRDGDISSVATLVFTDSYSGAMGAMEMGKANLLREIGFFVE